MPGESAVEQHATLLDSGSCSSSAMRTSDAYFLGRQRPVLCARGRPPPKSTLNRYDAENMSDMQAKAR